MLKAIQSYLEKLQPTESATEHGVELAAAALLVELMVTDDKTTDSERDTLIELLISEFGIEADEIQQLITLAEAEVAESNDLYQFTRLINDNFDKEQKFKLVKALWQIAYADDELDKYEEYTIRKIAELIHVSHSEFIRAKLAVNAIR